MDAAKARSRRGSKRDAGFCSYLSRSSRARDLRPRDRKCHRLLAGSHSAVSNGVLMNPIVPVEDLDRVPVEYLQHAFERSGISPAAGANNMGWFHSKSATPDSTRFLRTIGLRPMHEASNGSPAQFREKVPYDLAVTLLEACHFDPCDYGL